MNETIKYTKFYSDIFYQIYCELQQDIITSSKINLSSYNHYSRSANNKKNYYISESESCDLVLFVMLINIATDISINVNGESFVLILFITSCTRTTLPVKKIVSLEYLLGVAQRVLHNGLPVAGSATALYFVKP